MGRSYSGSREGQAPPAWYEDRYHSLDSRSRRRDYSRDRWDKNEYFGQVYFSLSVDILVMVDVVNLTLSGLRIEMGGRTGARQAKL